MDLRNGLKMRRDLDTSKRQLLMAKSVIRKQNRQISSLKESTIKYMTSNDLLKESAMKYMTSNELYSECLEKTMHKKQKYKDRSRTLKDKLDEYERKDRLSKAKRQSRRAYMGSYMDFPVFKAYCDEFPHVYFWLLKSDDEDLDIYKNYVKKYFDA